jgi:hypothetical protein
LSAIVDTPGSAGQHDAAGKRDGARAQIGAGAPRDDRDTVIGSQPQDPCDLLGVRRRDNSIRHPTEQRCRVARVHDKLAICQPEVLRSSDSAQLGQNGPRNTVFTKHCQLSKHGWHDIVYTTTVPSPTRLASASAQRIELGGRPRRHLIERIRHCFVFSPGTLGFLPEYCLGGMLGTDAGHSTAAAI